MPPRSGPDRVLDDDPFLPPFRFVASSARPQLIAERVRRRKEAPPPPRVAQPPDLTLDLVMYKAGLAPFPKKPSTPEPEPPPEEGAESVPLEYFDRSCVSPYSICVYAGYDEPSRDDDALITEAAAQCIASPCASNRSSTPLSAPDSPVRCAW